MNSQPLSIENRHSDVCTQIDFFIRSEHLRLADVSESLGIEATYGFEPRAQYLVKRNVSDEVPTVERIHPDFGVWHFGTSGLVESEVLEDHSRFLLNILEPACKKIAEFVSDPAFTVGMICWHVGPAGFQLSSSILARLAVLSEWISFTCWEINEE